jgi:hypothetical protein
LFASTSTPTTAVFTFVINRCVPIIINNYVICIIFSIVTIYIISLQNVSFSTL